MSTRYGECGRKKERMQDFVMLFGSKFPHIRQIFGFNQVDWFN